MTADAKVQKFVELELNRDQIIDTLRTCVSLLANQIINPGTIASPLFVAVLAQTMTNQLDSIQEESDPVANLQMERKFSVEIPFSMNFFIKNTIKEINCLAIYPDNANHVGALTDLLEMATSQLQTIEE